MAERKQILVTVLTDLSDAEIERSVLSVCMPEASGDDHEALEVKVMDPAQRARDENPLLMLTAQGVTAISLNGKELAPEKGSVLVISNDGVLNDPSMAKRLTDYLEGTGVKVVVLGEHVKFETLPRNQALGLLMTIVGIGRTEWEEIPDAELKQLIHVHRREAERMVDSLEARSA